MLLLNLERKNKPYIGIGSNRIIAKGEMLCKLQELTASIPFDDRINVSAKINDLDWGLIQVFLQEVDSDLLDESKKYLFRELCRLMHITKGADENLRPINAGPLFFSKAHENYISRCWIELVVHQDKSGDHT